MTVAYIQEHFLFIFIKSNNIYIQYFLKFYFIELILKNSENFALIIIIKNMIFKNCYQGLQKIYNKLQATKYNIDNI